MSSFELILRFIGLFLFFALPAGAVGAVLGGKEAAFSFAAVSSIVFFISFFSLEAWVRKALGDAAIEWPGLTTTLAQALKERGFSGALPRVLVLPEPIDQVMVMRSLVGHGTILISQGILAGQDEPTLRQILGQAANRLSSRGVVFQSACSLISLWILRLAPRASVALFFSGQRSRVPTQVTPFGALRFLFLLPWYRILVRIGRLETTTAESSSLLFSPIYLLVNLIRQG